MMKKIDFKEKIINIVKVLSLAIILVVGLNYVYAAWSGPTLGAPEGNTEPPFNVSMESQIKEGGLGVDTLAVFGDGLFTGKVTAEELCFPSGQCINEWEITPISAPEVEVSASPTTVSSGGDSTISWLATNATTCLAEDEWTTSTETSGTETKTNLTESKTYSMTCVGDGGSDTDSITITVDTKTVPSVPENFKLYHNPPVGIELSWGPPLDDGGSSINRYFLYRRARINGSWKPTEVFVLQENIYEYIDNDVENGAYYRYSIAAKNSVGVGEISVWKSISY